MALTDKEGFQATALVHGALSAVRRQGDPYSWADDQRIGCIAREVMIQAWETMQSDIFRTAGSSAAGRGERIERIFRDMSIGNSHRNIVLRDWAFRELGRATLGIPRDYEQQVVRYPRS